MNEVKNARQFLKLFLSMERPDSVAFIGPSRNGNWKNVIEYAHKCCNKVHVYDKDPYLSMETETSGPLPFMYCCTDVIFDKVDLSRYETIIVLSQEKMFPVPRKHKGNFILLVGKNPHNGNCTTDEDDMGMEVEENYLFERHRVLVGSN